MPFDASQPVSPALADFAREANNGAATIEDAIAALEVTLASHPEFDPELRRRGVWALIYRARTEDRQKLRDGGYEQPASMRSETKAEWSLDDATIEKNVARLAARRTLYDSPLPNSDISLGDATVDDLTAAAEFHDSRAAAEIALRDQFIAIRKLLVKSKAAKVRAGITLKQLASIVRASL